MSERTCNIDGCGSKVVARGWCRKHYNRWHKHGDPLYVTPWSPPPQNLPSRFGCEAEGCTGKHFAKGLCRKHYGAQHYRDNIDYYKSWQAVYRETRRDEARARVAVWRAANPEMAREARHRYNRENRTKIRESKRRYRKLNRDKIRTLNNKRKALKKNASINDLTAAEWRDIKAAYGHRCAYCGKRPKVLTMDHVIPLSKGGPHTASNIVPACGPCNFRKNAGPAPTFQPLLM